MSNSRKSRTSLAVMTGDGDADCPLVREPEAK
jgi:hypothetical protein